MKKLKLVTVHVPDEADPVLVKNYRFAVESNRKTLPPHVAFEVLALRHDDPDGKLKRDSAEEVGGERHLPFLGEALEISERAGTPWYGYVNSDIILTPDFNKFFDRMSKRLDLMAIQIRDVPDHASLDNPRTHKKRNNQCSIDGVLIRSGSGIDLGDYIIGEPVWDSHLRLLMKYELGERAGDMPTSCALHVKHESRWLEGVGWSSTVYGSDGPGWTGLGKAGSHNKRTLKAYEKWLRTEVFPRYRR